MQAETAGFRIAVENLRKRSFLKGSGNPGSRTLCMERESRMILGYTRVSKGEEQHSALQRKALKEAMVERIYKEKA